MFKDKYIIFVDHGAGIDEKELRTAYENLGAKVEIIYAHGVTDIVRVIKL